MNNLNKYLKNNYFLSIILLSLFFFFIYSYVSFQFPEKFNSPDEAANYFFIKKFVETNDFFYNEPLNNEFGNIIHPRNTRAIDGNIIPYSFIGQYLIFGLLAKIFSFKLTYFIVPFLSSLSVIFFYLALKEIFSEKISFLSSIILFIHPAFWFFSSLPFFHNALFASFFIFCLYSLIKIIKYKKLIYYLILGIFSGLAIITRTSEILWLLPLIIFFLLFYKKIIKPKFLIISIIALVIILLPMFYYNYSLYGSPFTVGYTSNLITSGSDSNNIIESSYLNKIFKIFLPTQVNIAKLKETISKYLIKIFSIYSIVTLIGIIYYLYKYKRLNIFKKTYFLVFSSISIFLIFYYGSGSYFGASGSAEDVTISSSLIRYWLPIYILSTPFMALIIYKIISVIKRSYLKIISFSTIFIILLFFSINIVFLNSNIGLLKYYENSTLYKNIEQNILNLTEQNSIIITTFADKIIFPKRKTIGLHNMLDHGQISKNVLSSISELSNKNPVYYMTIYGVDVDKTNNILRNYGIKIIPFDVINDISSLYKIVNIKY